MLATITRVLRVLADDGLVRIVPRLGDAQSVEVARRAASWRVFAPGTGHTGDEVEFDAYDAGTLDMERPEVQHLVMLLPFAR